MRLRRSLGVSLKALFAHKVRATLAVASVSVGVAALVLTGAISTGAEREVRRRIDAMGVNLLVVRPARVERFPPREEVKGTVTTLRLDDVQAIADLPVVSHAAPGVEGQVEVKADAAATTTRLLGTTPAFPVVRRFAVESGRFFDPDDDRNARRVAVLGARVADALFDGHPVGRQIRIERIPFEVIGVLAPKGVLADGDEDNQVLVPIRTALRRVFNTNWLNVVFVSARDPGSTAVAEAGIGAVLRQRHRAARDGEPDFEIQNADKFFALQQQAAGILGQFATGLAATAVVVGGTGIVGLMLLSVKERTGEIGLRIAVGARPRDILIQFLMEATILALGGWAAGTVVGAAGATVVRLSTAWPVATPVQAVLASLGMALALGLGFGVVPARRASRTPPIQALRRE
jgi:putative ABC transport system permease protein